MSKDFALMICNGCGVTDDSFQPEARRLIGAGADPIKYIKEIKKYFAAKGWKTSWGHDLCPNCAKEAKNGNV
jgi:hypothetical protein